MDLIIYLDGSDLEPEQNKEISLQLDNDISDWITKGQKNTYSLAAEIKQSEAVPKEKSKTGIRLQLKSKYKLKEPLNFLHAQAKKHKCEFVVAQFYPETGDIEDVCYFGYEEGRPDLHEIANYLSL